MKLAQIIQLLLFVSLMCTGQILFKKTALIAQKIKIEKNSDLISLILNVLQVPYFFLAMIIYAIATFYWLYILQKIPLSIAYPFTALAMVLIPIASVYLFKESLSTHYWIGSFLIFMGIVIISFSTRS